MGQFASGAHVTADPKGCIYDHLQTFLEQHVGSYRLFKMKMVLWSAGLVAIGTRQHKATDELSHPRGLASLVELPLGIYWH
jgi:hypothetical protein